MALMRPPPQTAALPRPGQLGFGKVQFCFLCMSTEPATGWIWQLPGAVVPLGSACKAVWWKSPLEHQPLPSHRISQPQAPSPC